MEIQSSVDEQVTAAVVAAAVDLAGIRDVLMPYLIDYTSMGNYTK